MKIGLISDTHGWLDEAVFKYFASCDEIWHAGDIGTIEVIEALAAFKPVRAVHGNIDGQDIRASYPQDLNFMCAGLSVWMTHIGGKPSKYTPSVLAQLKKETPNLFICGHSHILRVMHDTQHPPLLYLNPGAAGREGFHKVRTLLRFEISAKKVINMEVIELGRRS